MTPKKSNLSYSAAVLTTAFCVAAGAAFWGAPKMGLNPLMTDYDGAVHAVESQMGHLKDVKATGYGWFACSMGENGELWRTKFEAINTNNNEKVRGVVCEGLFKGATVRTFN